MPESGRLIPFCNLSQSHRYFEGIGNAKILRLELIIADLSQSHHCFEGNSNNRAGSSSSQING